MTAPNNQVYQDGVGTVDGDGLNTFLQAVTNVASAQAFTGTVGMTIWLQGTSVANDGGQGPFYWNATSTAPDDNGATTIAPSGATVGRWIRQAISQGGSSFTSISVSGAINLAANTNFTSDGTTVTLAGAFTTSGLVTAADLAVTAAKSASFVLAAPTGITGSPTWHRLSNSDITGLGTMATQAASAVAITGGTIQNVTLGGSSLAITGGSIDNAVIGGVTPNVGYFTNLNATISASIGVNGSAGSLTIYPATVNRGVVNFTASNNSGNTTTTINVATQSGARTLTVPDPGNSASFLLSAQAPATTGLFGSLFISILSVKNNDGTTLSASASSGKFGISSTPGTSEFLVTEAANSSTVTDVCQFEVVLPPTYIAGTNITVTVNGNYVLGGGTIGTHTLALAAYLTSTAGTQGANLIGTAAQTVPSSAGNMTFTITGATLSPGSRLMTTQTMVIQDTGGSNITGQINSVQLG